MTDASTFVTSAASLVLGVVLLEGEIQFAGEHERRATTLAYRAVGAMLIVAPFVRVKK